MVCVNQLVHIGLQKMLIQPMRISLIPFMKVVKRTLEKETIDSIKKLQTEFINSGSATQQFKLTDSWL